MNFVKLWFLGLIVFVMIGHGALASDRCEPVHFVPNSQSFWDNSEHWTTNFGPAYRDVVEGVSNLLPCSGTYALCFSSGPEPLPCELDKGGRFATCRCTIESGLQFVTINSILNYQVYLETIAVCGTDGSSCMNEVNKAPVCNYLARGKLIPGADVISDYSPQAMSAHRDALNAGPDLPGITHCSKGPYAGCMTAPCQIKDGFAECSCPVFWGPYQLYEAGAQCELGDGLVWSASYIPQLDRTRGE